MVRIDDINIMVEDSLDDFYKDGSRFKRMKLLIDLNPLTNGWNGTYNGLKLPQDDYWFHVYFENGNINYDDLLKSHSKILYVTETIGHGTNLVTGDYSVGATGFLIENGEFKHPVNEITIAGNFNEMFKNITLANDLEFKYSVNSPTMMIDDMTVAGK